MIKVELCPIEFKDFHLITKLAHAEPARPKCSTKNNQGSAPDYAPADDVVAAAAGTTTPMVFAERYPTPMVNDSSTAACELWERFQTYE
jgi:hypothetical protein